VTVLENPAQRVDRQLRAGHVDPIVGFARGKGAIVLASGWPVADWWLVRIAIADQSRGRASRGSLPCVREPLDAPWRSLLHQATRSRSRWLRFDLHRPGLQEI